MARKKSTKKQRKGMMPMHDQDMDDQMRGKGKRKQSRKRGRY